MVAFAASEELRSGSPAAEADDGGGALLAVAFALALAVALFASAFLDVASML